MVTVNANGTVTFRIYIPHAGNVELLADFSHWERGRLIMHDPDDGERGWWEVTTEVPAGDHAFSYLVDGHCWMPDYAASGVRRNEYGNWVSLLSMDEPHSQDHEVAGKPDAQQPRLQIRTARARDDSWKADGRCPSAHPLAG